MAKRHNQCRSTTSRRLSSPRPRSRSRGHDAAHRSFRRHVSPLRASSRPPAKLHVLPEPAADYHEFGLDSLPMHEVPGSRVPDIIQPSTSKLDAASASSKHSSSSHSTRRTHSPSPRTRHHVGSSGRRQVNQSPANMEKSRRSQSRSHNGESLHRGHRSRSRLSSPSSGGPNYAASHLSRRLKEKHRQDLINRLGPPVSEACSNFPPSSPLRHRASRQSISPHMEFSHSLNQGRRHSPSPELSPSRLSYSSPRADQARPWGISPSFRRRHDSSTRRLDLSPLSESPPRRPDLSPRCELPPRRPYPSPRFESDSPSRLDSSPRYESSPNRQALSPRYDWYPERPDFSSRHDWSPKYPHPRHEMSPRNLDLSPRYMSPTRPDMASRYDPSSRYLDRSPSRHGNSPLLEYAEGNHGQRFGASETDPYQEDESSSTPLGISFTPRLDIASASELQHILNITKKLKPTEECLKCRSPDHALPDCTLFRDLYPADRWLLVNQSPSICIKCLCQGHSASSCLSQMRCMVSGCSRLHHTLLHIPETTEHSMDCFAKKRGAAPVKCYNCDSPHHVVQNCPEAKCTRCAQVGHWSKQCPASS